uniref:Tc3 transposase DNA binding domain-containing protein n=1 Tax=Globisporangium ultimum (strain ATCC 200006 / CBS 805.95 / DAOM BR144) TaxID=431595 RepID=K3WKK4_GLOUD
MPGGTKLTLVEQDQIQVLKVQKLSLRAIAKTIGHSKNVAKNFLKDPHHYASKERAGRAFKLSERNHRAVFRHATINNKSSSQIVNLLSKPVSTRTVRRELQRNNNV